MARSADSSHDSAAQQAEPIAPIKRFNRKESDPVVADLQRLSIDQLDALFRQGAAPRFKEIEGATAGGLLTRRDRRWIFKILYQLLLDCRWSRWSGKGFTSTFDDAARGRGVNLFYNRIFPLRYRFKTYVAVAEADGEACLRLEYALGSILWGTIDDMRTINEGVFLGRIHYRFPWRRQRIDLGYFVLCALIPE